MTTCMLFHFVLKMLLQVSFHHFMIVLFVSPISCFSSIAKLGCPDRCGNLQIPYPFGVGLGCSLEPSFDVFCNISTNPPKAYLPSIKSEIIEINQQHIRVKLLNLAFSSRGGVFSSLVLNFSVTQYTFSDDNWVTAIGCDDMAALTVHAYNRTFVGGCVSYCENRYGITSCTDNNSLENGCCRTPIPKGAANLYVKLFDAHKNWRESKLFSTSNAFVGEKAILNQSTFSYPLSDLDHNWTTYQSPSWAAKNTPLVRLDWRVGAKNCNEAQKDPTTYACQSTTSDCIDLHASVVGYLCKCSQGYQGNPYLVSGCRDIDECAHSATNPCHSNAVCTNTIGGYTCECRKGYDGDAMKEGKGCIPRPQSKAINILIGLGTGLGFIPIITLCLMLYNAFQKRKKIKKKEEFFEFLLLQKYQTNEGLKRTKLFSPKELEKATDSFNDNRVLGQGTQGIVYKGMLSNGKIVAIKRLKLVDESQLKQLINEVVILSQINHKHVVQLLGCCLATEVPLIVYEFVPNGTLFSLIHDPNIGIPLSWDTRLKIAADIAGALAYLYYASSTPIFHRDVKSTNILLDEKFNVKVSDFGISKIVTVDQTHVSTNVRGTFGYFDPEYCRLGQFTEKSDVYSFGVVIVELLTGRNPFSLEITEGDRDLGSRFLASMAANHLNNMLDARLYMSQEGANEEVIAVAKLAERCLNPKGQMRPTMREAAMELENIRKSQMPSTM